MATRCDCERLEIIRIGGDDVIPVRREQYKRGVDHVAASGYSQEFTRRAAQDIIERANLHSGQRCGEKGLTRASASPGLSHDSAMRNRHVTGLSGFFL